MTTTSELRFRGRIFHPEEGYTPRSLLELRLRAAIGAILNKPQWWTKWRQPGGEIRAKWLAELEEHLVADTFDWSTSNWGIGPLDECVMVRYSNFPSSKTDEEKHAFIQAVCSTVEYNLIWNEKWWEEYETGEQEENDGDASDEDDVDMENGDDDNTEREGDNKIDESDRTVIMTNPGSKWKESLLSFKRGNRRMQSYGQITWYFELVLANNSFRKMPFEDWEAIDATQALEIGSAEAVAMVTQFVLAARRGEVMKQTIAAFCPGADVRPFVVDALWLHVDCIIAELDQIRACIIQTLDKVIENNGLDADVVTEFLSHGPIQEMWMSDVMISEELKHKFSSEVAILENVPDHEKDWHPGANNQVLDLVHPSLYCCVFGQTRGLATAVKQGDDSDDDVIKKMQRLTFLASELVTNDHRGSASFQWIPSDLSIDPRGEVSILSYINNLHPVKHRAMYESIASIFKQFVPMFDRVLSCLLNPDGPHCYLEIPDTIMYDRETHQIPKHPAIPELLRLQPPGTPFSLRGRRVQVIVKVAEIVLTPENPKYPGGSWHVEGTDAEQIVATGIYYFGSDNITESKLSFRVIVSEPNYEQDDTVGMSAMYGLQRDERLVQNLGYVTALENRCIVFPNTLQHHVDPFELEDDSKPGVRKILAFFIVDPSKTIPSTSTIPPQQAEWLKELQRSAISHLSGLPEVVLENTLKDMLGRGMSWEEAKQHREELMEERKPVADEDDDYELFFSLCEH